MTEIAKWTSHRCWKITESIWGLRNSGWLMNDVSASCFSGREGITLILFLGILSYLGKVVWSGMMESYNICLKYFLARYLMRFSYRRERERSIVPPPVFDTRSYDFKEIVWETHTPVPFTFWTAINNMLSSKTSALYLLVCFLFFGVFLLGYQKTFKRHALVFIFPFPFYFRYYEHCWNCRYNTIY